MRETTGGGRTNEARGARRHLNRGREHRAAAAAARVLARGCERGGRRRNYSAGLPAR